MTDVHYMTGLAPNGEVEDDDDYGEDAKFFGGGEELAVELIGDAFVAISQTSTTLPMLNVDELRRLIGELQGLVPRMRSNSRDQHRVRGRGRWRR